MKTVSRKDALRMIYYLMAMDGVTDEELQTFGELGAQLDEKFEEYKEELINECDHVIAAVEEDPVETIQEAIDANLYKTDADEKEVLSSRMLLWNLLVIANADGTYSEDEQKLIRHVARVCKIDKAVLQEMEQSMQTSRSLDKEIAYLEQSSRPYNEVRPQVEELEKRRTVVKESILALIADDVEAEADYVPDEKKTAWDQGVEKMQTQIKDQLAPLQEKMQPLTDKVTPIAEKMSPVAAQISEGSKKAGEQIGKGVADAAASLKAGATGLFGKIGKKGDK